MTDIDLSTWALEDICERWERELLQVVRDVDVPLVASLELEAERRGVNIESVFSALTAAWDPNLHPRGKDGMFIEIGGLIKLVGLSFNGKDGKMKSLDGRRGKVMSITPNPKKPDEPNIRVALLDKDGKPSVIIDTVKPNQIIQAPEKARLDVDAPDRKRGGTDSPFDDGEGPSEDAGSGGPSDARKFTDSGGLKNTITRFGSEYDYDPELNSGKTLEEAAATQKQIGFVDDSGEQIYVTPNEIGGDMPDPTVTLPDSNDVPDEMANEVADDLDIEDAVARWQETGDPVDGTDAANLMLGRGKERGDSDEKIRSDIGDVFGDAVTDLDISDDYKWNVDNGGSSGDGYDAEYEDLQDAVNAKLDELGLDADSIGEDEYDDFFGDVMGVMEDPEITDKDSEIIDIANGYGVNPIDNGPDMSSGPDWQQTGKDYDELTPDEQAAWKKEVGITETDTGFKLESQSTEEATANYVANLKTMPDDELNARIDTFEEFLAKDTGSDKYKSVLKDTLDLVKAERAQRDNLGDGGEGDAFVDDDGTFVPSKPSGASPVMETGFRMQQQTAVDDIKRTFEPDQFDGELRDSFTHFDSSLSEYRDTMTGGRLDEVNEAKQRLVDAYYEVQDTDGWDDVDASVQETFMEMFESDLFEGELGDYTMPDTTIDGPTASSTADREALSSAPDAAEVTRGATATFVDHPGFPDGVDFMFRDEQGWERRDRNVMGDGDRTTVTDPALVDQLNIAIRAPEPIDPGWSQTDSGTWEYSAGDSPGTQFGDAYGEVTLNDDGSYEWYAAESDGSQINAGTATSLDAAKSNIKSAVGGDAPESPAVAEARALAKPESYGGKVAVFDDTGDASYDQEKPFATWVTNDDGSKNGGRASFATREEAEAYADEANRLTDLVEGNGPAFDMDDDAAVARIMELDAKHGGKLIYPDLRGLEGQERDENAELRGWSQGHRDLYDRAMDEKLTGTTDSETGPFPDVPEPEPQAVPDAQVTGPDSGFEGSTVKLLDGGNATPGSKVTNVKDGKTYTIEGVYNSPSLKPDTYVRLRDSTGKLSYKSKRSLKASSADTPAAEPAVSEASTAPDLAPNPPTGKGKTVPDSAIKQGALQPYGDGTTIWDGFGYNSGLRVQGSGPWSGTATLDHGATSGDTDDATGVTTWSEDINGEKVPVTAWRVESMNGKWPTTKPEIEKMRTFWNVNRGRMSDLVEDYYDAHSTTGTGKFRNSRFTAQELPDGGGWYVTNYDNGKPVGVINADGSTELVDAPPAALAL